MGEGAARATVVIPARYGSTRFPGKPLVSLLGKPLIQHVYERVSTAPGVHRVVVGTDDERIRDAVRGFGGEAVLMPEPYRTGTDRVAALAGQLDGDLFVNLQGDEIPLHPSLLTDLITPFASSGEGMGTLKRRLGSDEPLTNAGIVKVVTDVEGHALYFSRAPIPLVRDAQPGTTFAGLHFIHLGVYIFRRETLRRFAELPTGRLEDAEKLEQLRALEQGIPIRVWETAYPSLRIDAPEDVPNAERALRSAAPAPAFQPAGG